MIKIFQLILLITLSIATFAQSKGDGVVEIRRSSSDSPGFANGSQLFFSSLADDGLIYTSNKIISNWSTPTAGSRVSTYTISGVNSASTQNLFQLRGDGQLTLNQYTTSNFNGGSATDSLMVITSTGVVKKRNPASVFGGITANNGITANTSTNVQLGGSLNQDTHISGVDNYALLIDSSTNITLLTDISGSSFSMLDLAHTYFELRHDIGSSHYNQIQSTDGINGITFNSVNSAIQSTITLRPDSISLLPYLGKINIDSLRAGASTDSIMVWNKTTGKVGYISSSSISTSITADEGITASTSTNVQLGSLSNSGVPLTTTRYINTGSNTLRIRGSSALYPLYAENTSTGFGAYIESVGGVAAQMAISPSSTNTIATVLNIVRGSSGTAANGIGGAIDFYNQTVANGSVYSGSISNKWVDAANATRTSYAIIYGVDNTTTKSYLTLQPAYQLVNNDADTLATRAYARSAGGGGGGTPGGSNTQVQFNNSGAFGGSANLTWDGTYLSSSGIYINSPSADANHSAIVRSPDNTSTHGLKVVANNQSADMQIGYNEILSSQQLNLNSSVNGIALRQKTYVGASSVPTALLHLAAGTATANTAPLKLTSGTNLTTPEDGAIEYNGTNYYATSGSTRYQVSLSLSNSATLDFGSTSAGASTDLTITVTGAAVGDYVVLGVPNGSVPNNGGFFGWVSATDTVTVRYFNNDLTNAKDPASGTFKATVLK